MHRSPHALDFFLARSAFLAGKDDPRAYLERCLETIAARDPEVRAFVTLGLDGARKAADESVKRYRDGKPLSAVDGMPLGVKDIMDTFDLPTQMGNPIYKDWQPRWDAACVHALRTGGAIVVGKTVTTAFAGGETNETRNPLDTRRTPGGSSSGSAASVGAGMVPVALGTQTQGSVIRPAGYCGTFGFKPTHGALTMQGVHPISLSHDHLGVIAGSLEDLWTTAHRVASVSGSPGSAGLNGASESLPAARKPGRLLVQYTPAWENEVDAQSRASFEGLLERLRTAGVQLVTRSEHAEYASLEDDFFAKLVDRSVDITAYEMLWPYQQYYAKYPDLLEKRQRERILSARDFTPAYYAELLAEKVQAKERTRRTMEGFDAIVTLSSSGPAPLGHAYTGSRTYLLFASFLQLPAFSLPLLHADGMPFGAQIIGHEGKDGDLCALARWMTSSLA